MLPSEAQTVPSREVKCDLDYLISQTQALPQIHLSKDCAQTNFVVPAACSYFCPNVRFVTSGMRCLIVIRLECLVISE